MKKTVFSSALILTVLGVGMVGAAEPAAPPAEPLNMPAPMSTPGYFAPSAGAGLPTAPVSADGQPAPAPMAHHLSNWILYQHPDCCGPLGADGPIDSHLYVRAGTSLPVEGSIFGHTLQAGWEIQGGARTLFFNKEMDADWAIDLSISNIYNHGQHSDIVIPVTVGATTNAETVHDLNRTFVNVGLGRDWYIYGPANACGYKWVWGFDGGGRLGSAKLQMQTFPGGITAPHRTDVISGVFLALHTEVEHSCGCCTFSYGFRAEWDYTWMDILSFRNDSDLMDVNLLFTAGVRF
jgi:hypothetical protein